MKKSQQKSFFLLLFNRLLFVKKYQKPEKFFTECIIYAVLLLWGITFFKASHLDVSRYGFFDAILHNVDLMFHEAGHLFFAFFGNFIKALGGTIMQCLIPVLVMLYFIRRRENFPATVALWWLGQNFLDVAPYIYDAWDRVLPLIGGSHSHPDSHDWYYILKQLNRLDKYAEISSLTARLGRFTVFLSLVWGAVILYRQFLIQKISGLKSKWETED